MVNPTQKRWQLIDLKLKFGSSIESESKALDGPYAHIFKHLHWHVYELYHNLNNMSSLLSYFIIVIKYKLSDYGLWYIHVMDICMNASMLADYINASARVAIGAGCPWCIVLSVEFFFVCF